MSRSAWRRVADSTSTITCCSGVGSKKSPDIGVGYFPDIDRPPSRSTLPTRRGASRIGRTASSVRLTAAAICGRAPSSDGDQRLKDVGLDLLNQPHQFRLEG